MDVAQCMASNRHSFSNGARSVQEKTVFAAVRRLYCAGAHLYTKYRDSKPTGNEAHAWSAVDEFVHQHKLTEATILDLGCGSGSPIIASWEPREYLGYDISRPLLQQHVMRSRPHVSLEEADLNVHQITCPAPQDGPVLVLSVLLMHYLSNPEQLIRSLAYPGHWFCFVVANAQHDRAYLDSYGLVHLKQNGLNFTYFLRALTEYVRWLTYPRLLHAAQCGEVASSDGYLPYYLIGGQW